MALRSFGRIASRGSILAFALLVSWSSPFLADAGEPGKAAAVDDAVQRRARVARQADTLPDTSADKSADTVAATKVAAEPGHPDIDADLDEERDADEIDAALESFDAADDDDADDFPNLLDTAFSEAPLRRWNLSGDFGLATTIGIHDHKSQTGTQFRGLQRLRAKLSLQFDMALPRKWNLRSSGYADYDAAYRIRGRSQFTDEVLDTYESDVQLTDTYLEGSLLDTVDLKIGRQVVNWGRSETLRVLDVINPIDNREPGLVDIKDTRLPLAMARFGFFTGPWALTALIIPEIRFDFVPPVGSDLAPSFPLPPLPPGFAPQILFNDRKRSDFSKDTEYALNLTGTFNGWDVSLETAYFWNDLPNARTIHFGSGAFNVTLEHARLWLVGGGANYTIGSWLFKAEFAYLDGFHFFVSDRQKSRIDAMLGLEFYGWNNLNITFEMAQRHLNHFEKTMKQLPDFAQQNSLESTLRISWDLLNQRLHLTGLGLVLGEAAQDGSFIRLSAGYDIIDALQVETGFVLFQNGDNLFFRNSGKNDQFFAAVKYSF